jgi:glycosyltransferase involved in cell wall biosynthesis
MTHPAPIDSGIMLEREPLSAPQKRASILYIHVCGSFGGSSRSLLEMIKAFPPGSIQAHVITPEGNVAELFRKEGIPVIECAGISQFDNTEYGYYRGRRWLILLRELFYVLPTLIALLRAKTRWAPIDLIHVNEITGLPAIVFAKLIFRKPLILHVRSVQQTSKAQSRTRMIRFIVRRFCDAVVAIDETVRESLPKGIESQMIHNGFLATPGCENQVHPALRGHREGELRVALVGQLLPMKGVYEFIEAARLCKARGINAKFILVGEDSRDLSGPLGILFRKFGFAREVRGDAERLIEQHELRESVLLLGFTPNIRSVYQNIDVICFPSHLNAVGRPVFEAAFFGVPSIVAVTNPQSDTFIHRETGLGIEARNPVALADAIEYFYRNPDEIKRMGEAARKLAVEQFSIVNTAKKMLEIYETQIGQEKNLGRLEQLIRP